jgi:membrane protease YdiL (CAAX protease family)
MKNIFRNQINNPPRASKFGAALLILLIVVYGLFLTHALPQAANKWLPCVMILLLPLATVSRSIYTVHFNLFLLGFYLMNFFPHFPRYPFNHLTVLLLYAYVVMLIPALRDSVGWVRMGKFDANIWIFILATVIIPGVGLLLWVKIFSPDLSRYSQLVPDFPLWLTVLYGLGNSAFNAALEEITWRGVMMEALDSALGPGFWTIIIQSVSFAVAHYRNGFPNGIIGCALVFVFGMMLGILRRKSKGIVGCWLAHTGVDFTIYCLVLYFIQGHPNL